MKYHVTGFDCYIEQDMDVMIHYINIGALFKFTPIFKVFVALTNSYKTWI